MRNIVISTFLPLLTLTLSLPAIRLSETAHLLFSAGGHTTPARREPSPQLICVGPACSQKALQPEHVYCENTHSAPMWRCAAALPRGAAIEVWAVHCEKYQQDDDVVVKDSCWLRYKLVFEQLDADTLEGVVEPGSSIWTRIRVLIIAMVILISALCIIPLPRSYRRTERPLLEATSRARYSTM